MIVLEFFRWVGSIRKSIKKPIFSKKNYFSNHRGSFVITKNVLFFCFFFFFFYKLITPKLNGNLYKNHDNADYKLL